MESQNTQIKQNATSSNWQVSPANPRNTRQKTLKDYWLGTTQTSNRYEALSDNEEEVEQNTNENTTKQDKPPPIFVYGVDNMIPLTELLETNAKGEYTNKLIGNSQLKIQLKDGKTYNTIIKILQEKKTEFHSYQNKSEKNFKVVIKELHHSTDLKYLKEEIESHGHVVANITNIRHRVNKTPLPLFFVEIQKNDNNKDIYEIEYLTHMKVKIEPPKQKREVLQCKRCQRFSHTQAYCHRSPRCVKCAGDHLTSECKWKDNKNKDVKCVLCEGNHPASYKGCTVYKETRKRKFPPIRANQLTKDAPNLNLNANSIKQNGISYAQATSDGIPPPQNLNFLQENSNDMTELKQMMKKLMEQMGNMLNLLTSIVSKLK